MITSEVVPVTQSVQLNGQAESKLKHHFLGWQCRLRQIAMRKDGGRPSSGMRPRLLSEQGHELVAGLSIVIVPEDSQESTEFFRFQVQKTHDPRQVYEKGLTYLQSTHFQKAKSFSDRMTALFSRGAELPMALLDSGQCILEFAQFSQSYRLVCSVSELSSDHDHAQATIWHNRLFNPNLPADVQVIAFQPDWEASDADPSP
ncbi:hypothetical protein [Pelagibius sp. Alg239-R121]|uniref:hypothetical protein n=1 Tax=Pelagibius sp. Alg239-R121 TaxID=2993448 RepID=UPI0024A7742A|nr:hypothetical protein [Pelagibius sp. Alg239-R121]